jgi:alkanesulfonate monooxygenase SsuD/methylene tetrahydromethanopterin reductase-like flavin-dependent oxidoreductase (luciferase family)
VKFGVYYTFRNLDEPASSRFYGEVLDQIVAVEELGYDYVLLTEHHFVRDGYLPSMMPMLGAIAARTSRIGIGTHILILPLHHPIRVAEDAAVIDLLSGGRLVLGVAAGYRPSEFEAFGVDATKRGKLMEDGLTTIRDAWSHESKVFPKPERAIPLWVGGFAPGAIARAVRLGDAYLIGGKAVASGGPYQAYLDELDKQGKTRAQVPLVGNRVVHVAPTDEQAWTEVGEALVYQHNSYATWFAEAGDARGIQPVGGVADLPDDLIVGSPETCRQKLEAYLELTPVDVMTFNAHIVGTSLEVALASLELFSRDVLPAFKER